MESAGLPSVSVFIRSFGHVPELMGLSRALVVEHPLGRQLGAPGDAERQSAVVRAALDLLQSDDQVIAEFGQPYRWVEGTG